MFAFFIDFYVVVSDGDSNPRFPIGAQCIFECQCVVLQSCSRVILHVC